MIKCSACSLENPDDGKFCTNCGKPLEIPNPIAPGMAGFCTNCGAQISGDSKFCTGCGAAVGQGSALGGGVAVSRTAAAREVLPVLEQRLTQNGFESIERPAVLNLDLWMRRTRFELAKVGMITTICGIKVLDQAATPGYVQSFSKSVFDFAVSNKGFLARNAFQQLLVYPVVVAPSYEPAVEGFLNSYWNKHWMAYEYPVVLSVSTRQAAMHRSTPIWGAAFHGSFRREAESLFAP